MHRATVTRHYSPLRYPGGKARLAPFVQKVCEASNLMGGEYAEPYAGGASVALSLLLLEFVSIIHINDISKPVYYFWQSVLHDTDGLSKFIRDKRATPAEWTRQKSILRDIKNHSRLEVAFAFFFLNRTNRSGIIHTGGMIGGKDQKGAWKLDARYNKQDLLRRIEAIALYSNRIKVTNLDAEEFLSNRLRNLPQKSLVYLDPPYFEQGASLYENHYVPKDHYRLAKKITGMSFANWLVSYDNKPQVRKAYKGFRKRVYTLSYSAARRYVGSEVMFFGNNLVIPRLSALQSR